MPPRPFHVEVPEATLADLRERLARVRWPDQAHGAEWAFGSRLAYLEELAADREGRHGQPAHAGRAAGAAPTPPPRSPPRGRGVALPSTQGGGRGPKPLPLLLSHGWPG